MIIISIELCNNSSVVVVMIVIMMMMIRIPHVVVEGIALDPIVLTVVGFQLLIQVKGFPEKAPIPILVTFTGMVTDVSVLYRNAKSDIIVTVAGITIDEIGQL